MPTGVSGTSNENTKSTITWSAPASNGGATITDYQVTVYNSSGGDPVGVTGDWTRNVGSAGTSFIFTGLTNGTVYAFKVAAVNASGVGANSDASAVLTPATVPGIPLINSVVGGNSQVTINFTPGNSGGSAITSYIVTSNEGLTTAGAGSPIIFAGLANGSYYYFRVKAVNDIGIGSNSEPSGIVIPSTVPGAPVLDAPVRGNTQIGLSWSVPSTGGSAITDYLIKYKLTTEPTAWTTFEDGTSTDAYATVTSLTNGLSYDFKVIAVNDVDPAGGIASNIQTKTPATVPGAPVLDAPVRGNTQIGLSWSVPSTGGSAITDYLIKYKLTTEPTAWTTFEDGTSTDAYATVTSLTNGLSYDFKVIAVNDVDPAGGIASNIQTKTPATVPGIPVITNVTSGNQQATIYFTVDDGGSTITQYTINPNIGSPLISISGSPITITGLTNGSSYTFTMTATNANGTGSASEESDAVIPAVPIVAPDAPTNLAGTAHDGYVSLTWTEPSDNGGSAIADYIVEYKLSSNGTWSLFSDGTGTSTAANVTPLSNNNSYDFRVSAKNGANLTGPSSASITKTPAPPAHVSVDDIPDKIVPRISAKIHIKNEGSTPYEYHYTYCVTDSELNLCGGGNDVSSGSGSTLVPVLSGADYFETIDIDVPSPGNYYFHLSVQYGSEISPGFRSFTAVAETVTPPVVPAGGGSSGNSSAPIVSAMACGGADFNCDGKVNSVDFSIMLYYWKAKSPFANRYVDINNDAQVNSVDFSILLYQWGKKPIAFKKP